MRILGWWLLIKQCGFPNLFYVDEVLGSSHCEFVFDEMFA